VKTIRTSSFFWKSYLIFLCTAKDLPVCACFLNSDLSAFSPSEKKIKSPLWRLTRRSYARFKNYTFSDVPSSPFYPLPLLRTVSDKIFIGPLDPPKFSIRQEISIISRAQKQVATTET